MRNAVRRRLILRSSRCGAAPTLTLPRLRGREWEGAARLPAFHRGSSLGTHASQGAASDQVSRSGAPIRGGVLPPAPAPVAASTSHAGHNAGRHDVRNRPGTACNSVRGRRPRPMARHASGPPPSRARTITYHNQRQCQEQRHRKDDIKRSRGIGSRTKSNRTMCAVWFLLVFVGASGQGPDLAAIDANDDPARQFDRFFCQWNSMVGDFQTLMIHSHRSIRDCASNLPRCGPRKHGIYARTVAFRTSSAAAIDRHDSAADHNGRIRRFPYAISDSRGRSMCSITFRGLGCAGGPIVLARLFAFDRRVA